VQIAPVSHLFTKKCKNITEDFGRTYLKEMLMGSRPCQRHLGLPILG
jgi:hypothetical protein